MTEIDYKKKLKIMKRVSDIHLTKKHLEMLYRIFFATEKTRKYKEIHSNDIEKIRLLDDLMSIGLVDKEDVNVSLFERYRINTNWLQLIIKIAGEENKSRRDRKILPRANKQSPLRPFISIIIAIWALIVAISKN